MTTAYVINISRCCVDDGPGIRTTVFLKGCPLRCLWCHNPESQRKDPEITFDSRKCTACGRCAAACDHGGHTVSDGNHTFDRSGCIRCGACADACRAESLTLVGKEMTVDEAAAEAERDRIFYETSGGGVTISGGEPLAHRKFTAELLQKLRSDGIHTAIETSGYCDPDTFRHIATLCDLLLFDLKETDPVLHKRYTGVELAPILANLRMAGELGVPVHLRMPIIPGLNDREAHLTAAAELARSIPTLTAAQIMPYHKLGAYKYETLGGRYTLSDIKEPDADTKKRWQAMLDEKIKRS